ncbi:MAG: transporter substrate-binding domain-containing protein, partial [Oxalobacteraceae bacterium]
ELISELARRSGCEFKLLPLPRAREMLEFQQGQLDILTSVSQSPDRDRAGLFLPYAYGEWAMLALPGGPRQLEELRQNTAFKLGVVRGMRLSWLQDTVNGLAAAGQVEFSPDFYNLVAKLNAGRVQAVLLPSVIVAWMRQDGQLPAEVVRLELPGSAPDPIGLYVSHDTVPLRDVKLLQRHLDAMRREGWMRANYVRYVGEAETKRLFRTDRRR